MKTPDDQYKIDLTLLRSRVLTICGSLLGTYKRADNSLAPALFVSPPESPLNYVVSGIQAVIAEPEETAQGMIGGASQFNDRWFIVVFTQYDSSKALRDLKWVVKTKLIPLYGTGELSHLMPTSLGNLEQLTVRLYAPQLIMLR